MHLSALSGNVQAGLTEQSQYGIKRQNRLIPVRSYLRVERLQFIAFSGVFARGIRLAGSVRDAAE
jgi:hypothetical protein